MFESQARPPFGNKIFGRRTLLLWIIIGTLLFLSILAGSALFFSQSKSTQSPAPPKGGGDKLPEGGTTSGGNVPPDSNSSANIGLTPKAAIFLSNKEIAGKILAWLDKTRVFGKKINNLSNSDTFMCDGGYAEGEDCNIEDKCNMKDPANYVGLTATWARFKYYEKYKSPQDLAILKKDLAVYADTKKISAIQPNFWSIKFLYEMWKSLLFTPQDKQNIETIIYRVTHNPEILRPSEKIVREKGKTEELDLAQFKNKLFAYKGKTVNVQYLDQYAVTSSDYVYSFLYLKESKLIPNPEEYLNIAIDLFNNGVIAYSRSHNLDGNSNSPYLLGVAALDIYKVTNRPQYLDYAQYLFNEYKAQQCLQAENCAIKVTFALDLYNLTSKNEYKTFAENIAKYLYDNYYDLETLGGFKYNKGVYYQIIDKEKNYLLLSNAVLVNVLISL